MSRDLKPKRAPARRNARGGTLIGLFIGLVLGIVGAALVVWYINKMPTPFTKPPVPQPSARPEASAASAGKPGQPIPLPGKPGDAVPEKRFQFYDILPGKAEAKVDPATSADKPADKPADKAAEAPKGGKEAKEAKDMLKEPMFLQAGSFQNAGDADNQKAKLAMIGLEAELQQVMVQDKVWYRVRLGPFNRLDEVNKVRAELAKQGIEAGVAKKD